jgi:HDOD domain
MRTQTARHQPAQLAAAQQLADQQLVDVLRRLPSRPLLLDAAVAHLAAGAPARGQEEMAARGYRNLRVALQESPGDGAEMKAIWLSSVACGYYAAQLAFALGFDLRDAAAAGLLHRAGESRIRVGLDKLGVGLETRFIAEHDAVLSSRLLSAWSMPAPVVQAASEWRTGSGPGLAGIIYLSHLLALIEVDPQRVPPGIERSAAAELGVDAALLDKLSAGRQSLAHWLPRL